MTITKEGALASFYTVNKAPIKHLKVYFSPKQVGEGDPSPDNVREISGYNQIKVELGSKNLTQFSSGTTTWYKPANFSSDYITYYGFIDNTLGNTNVRLAARTGSRGTYYSDAVKPGEHRAVYIKIPISDSTRVQLKVSNASSNTIIQQRGLWPYVEENNKLINFDETMYGGYVDLVTGEVVEEWISINIPDTTNKILGSAGSFINNSQYQGDTFTHRYFVISQPSTTSVDLFSDRFTKGNPYNTAWKWCYDGTGLIHFSVDNETIGVTSETSAADRNVAVAAWLQENPTQMVYKLQTPITHQLTPLQLQTLIGQNNIWSNADHVEVEYDLAESNDELYRRRNIILRSAPHIETATGSIASFNTDMQAPIKNAKISFSPIQEGEGYPSPDNVRPISGWDEIEIFQANQNLLDPYTIILSDGSYSMGNYPISFAYENGTCIGYAPSGTINQMQFLFKQWLVAGIEYRVSYGQVTVILDDGNEKTESIWTFDWFDETLTKRMSNASTFTPSQSGYYYLKMGTYPIGKVYELHINDIKITINNDSIFHITDSKKTTINWTNDIGTIYGGYIDISNGKIMEDATPEGYPYKIIILNGEEEWTLVTQDDNSTIFKYSYGDGARSEGRSMCSHFMLKLPCYKALNCINGFVHGMSGNLFIQPSNAIASTVQEFCTYLAQEYNKGTPVTILYQSRTLLEHTIAPTQLKTLRGTNNIWSNANGNIELSYWKH